MNSKLEFDSVNSTVKELHNGLLMHVTYITKEGKRDEFIQKVKDLGIMTASQQEPGNLFYEYYYPIDDENSVLLVEAWTNTDSQVQHTKTEHFQTLSEIKNEYVETTLIKKFTASDAI
ncbi:MAG: antibiotic biosynthesis monooxygenase [Clostridiaceae bacterium]|nr:antibiotic biosynthesis monooxygenase [Clostridiaceae bacterium]